MPQTICTLPDYENYECDSKETPAYLAQIRATLNKDVSNVSEPKNDFGFPHAAPMVSGNASQEAISFLAAIDPEWLLELLYNESLDIYEGEKVIGKYSVNISRVPNDIHQFVYHITSNYTSETRGTKIEEIHEAIVTEKLETTCQKRTYLETGSLVSIDNRCYYEVQPSGHCSVTVLNSENQMVTSWLNVYTKPEINGFIGECAHVLLARLLASDEKVPENFRVLALDGFGHFRMVQYVSECQVSAKNQNRLPPKMLEFRPHKVECFGFMRELALGREQKLGLTNEYFLNRRLVCRESSESDAIVKTNTIPVWGRTNFVKPPDPQVPPSLSVDDSWIIKMRRNELNALFQKKFVNTVAKYPQLTQPLKEMTHSILTVRPDDVFAFVTQSFRNWKDIYADPELLNSSGMMLALNHKDKPAEPQEKVYSLLRACGVNNE